MKKRLLQIVIIMMSLAIGQLNAQLTGIKTIPGDYATISAAVTALNTQGVGAGGVTFNVAAGYTEAAPAGGILLGSAVLNASISATNQIVFQKSGAGLNPLITAFTPGISTTVDGIWIVQGTDFVTIDGIDLQENTSNTTPTQQMEWGYALVKLSNIAPFDGCQSVIIKNSTITLNKANTNSIGIYSGNHIATSTTSLTITAPTDASNNCKFFGNTITNCYGAISLNGFSAPAPYTLYDQNNEVGVTAGNTITNFGGGSVSVRAIYGIYQNGMKVVSNNISSSVAGSTTTVYGVFLSTGTSSNADINNNTISLSYATGTFTSTVYGINNAMGSTALSNTININNNTFQNCDFSGFSSGNFYAILNSGTATTVNINNNNINTITMAGTGSSTYVIEIGSPVSGNMNSNTITNITRTGASGTIYGLKITSPTNLTATGNLVDGINYNNTASTGTIYGFYGLSSSVNVTITNNIFRNFSTPTTGSLYGIREWGTTGTKTIQNNQVYNFSTYSGGAGGASMYGIYCSIGNIEISRNQVYSLNSTGTTGGTGGTLAGVYISGGTTNNIFKNKIYNISSNSTNPSMYGIYIGGGTTNNIHNNYVGDLRTPAANAAIPLSGIYLSSGTTNNLYYNTVYLNSTSTGALFGSTSLYASTTPTVLLQNNIFVNLSVPNGATGYTSAYRRSSTTLTTYAAASNNNLFYAGTPSANNVIYYDGTTAQSTLAAYKTLVSPRDALSVTENPPFISTSGSSSNFLHISNSTPTQVESGGIPVTGITDDYDGDVRNASTPDIGADEGTFILLDINPPLISFTPLQNSCSTGIRTLVATITDPSGVPTSGIGLPVLYWSNGSATGPWTSSTGSSIGSNQYQFSLGAGSVVGNNIYYYVVAQDMASTPNIGSNPSAGAGGFTPNPPAAATPPTTPYSYVNLPTMSGTYTVGATGFYTSLGAAATAYNSSCISGPVVFQLIDPSYGAGETFPIVFNANPGSSSVNTLTIKPTVVSTITGSGTSIFKLNGADYIIFDGSISNTVNSVCPMVTASRDLTIINTSTAASTCVIWNGSASSSDGATNNIFKNLNVLGAPYTTPPAYTFIDIFSGSGVTAGGVAEAPNSYCLFENNSCGRAQYGITIAGATALNQGDIVRLNSIGSSTSTDRLTFIGMFFSNSNNLTVDKNTVFDIVTSSNNPIGISIAANVLNSVFNRNHVQNIAYTGSGGYGGKGININTGVASSNLTISNNQVTEIKGDGYSTFTGDAIVGIRLLGTTGGVKLYGNTVYLGSGTFGGYGTSGNSAAVYIASTNTNLDIRNNIFGSNLFNSNYASAKTYAFYSAAPNTAFSVINYNDYFVTGAQGVLGAVNSTDVTTLAALKAATGQDANSQNVTPVFVSSLDAHLVMSDPANAPLMCAGTALPTTTDIDCNPRSALTPTLGADENPNILTVSLAVVENSNALPNGTVCAGEAVDINSSVTNASGSQTYLWSPGGATTPNLTGVIPTSPSTTYTVTVTDGGCQNSASITVVVNPIVTPTFTQLGPYCLNSTPGTLPATSLEGITGTWLPSTISTATVGQITYNFTPNTGQCANPTSMTIVVNGPTLSETHVLPTTCTSANGSIDLTVLPQTGSYTYSWIGPNNYTASTQDISGLNGGFYTVTVTDGFQCQNTLTVNLDLIPSCLACPVIGNLSANPNPVCQGKQTTLTASGLVGLGVTYGIKFVYSATSLTPTQLYGGSGTQISIIPPNPSGFGPTATANYTFNVTGNLFIYAILDPAPQDQSCRPVAVSTITVNSLPPLPIVQNITTCVGGSTLIVPTTTGGGTSTVSNTFTWDFEGGITGGGVSQYPGIATNGPAQTVGAGITMSAISGSTVCTAAVTTSGYNIAPNNTLADAKTSGDYIEFCIGSAVAPSVFSGVTAINWANRASNTGPVNYVLVASNDINTTLLSGTVTPNGSTCELEGGNIPLNTSTCYRIYYYSATSSGGTLRIDNLVITAAFTSPYSGGTFNFYSDAALTNKVAGPAASYDPMTTPLNSPQTIWVTQINTVTGCESAAVPVVITVYNVPTAEAGNNQFYCGLPASITISATSNYNGQWTQTGGAGTIVSPTSKTTTYNTNPADIGKTVVFTWTTITPQGACPNVTDKMGLTTVRPTADAEFAYAFDEYCPGSSNPTVTHVTGVNGIYTYQVVNGGPVLALNKNTGEINMNTSDEGTYDVTNTVDGRGNLIITGVIDGPLSGGLPKAIELYAVKAISDLSRYGIESANNGGGSAGVPEYTFPSQSVAAGTYIWVSSETPQFISFFGFAPTFISSVALINGDDAVVLYNDGQAIDVFGDVSYTANTPLPWKYEDGWAYRKNSTVNDGTVFNPNNWTYSGVNIWGTAATNATATKPFPIKTFTTTLPGGCANNSHTETIIIGDIFPPVISCPPDQNVYLDGGECSIFLWYDDPDVFDNCDGDPIITKISGPDKGSEFTLIGSPYTIEFEVYDAHGNGPVNCSFDIAIHGWPQPVTGMLACNDTIQMSLNDDCEILMNADMFLEGGPYMCYNMFQVYVNSVNYNNVNVSNKYIHLDPGSYIVTVADAAAGNNTCNTTILVMDKIIPEVECNCPENGTFPANQQWIAPITGKFTDKDLTYNIFSNCYDFGTEERLPDWGPHYYDVYPIYVSATGDYDLVAYDDNQRAIVGVYESFFNSGQVCNNLSEGIGGWFSDFFGTLYYVEPNRAIQLKAGKKYYVVVSDFDDEFTGNYTINISSTTGGKVYFAENIYSDDCKFGGCYNPSQVYNFSAPEVTDNCDVKINLIKSEIRAGNACGTQILTNTWEVTDIGGNKASCTQEYLFQGLDLANLTWPKNFDNLPWNNKMIECDANIPLDAEGNPHPSFTGYPEGWQSSCSLVEIFYTDEVHKLDCGVKILRNWVVVDDCRGTVQSKIQIIRITDTKEPTFCPQKNFRVPAKGYICNADVEIPEISCLEDNCCSDVNWWITTNMNFPVTGDINNNGYVDKNEKWVLKNVPNGIYELCYHVIDCCGNEAIQCVLFDVYDATPPIPVCEQYKTVSLTVSADARVDAIDFNSGSFDNCNPVYFKVLRVNNNNEYDGGCPDLNGDDNPKTPTTNDVWYDDEVFFCCPDAGNQVMVSMRVFDIDPGFGPVDPKRYLFGGDLYGHYNDCWSIVTVECKIPPALTCPPVEISCEESLDPNDNPKLWPITTSICGVDLSYSDARDNSVCSANITRTWTAKSCTKTTQCKQSIKVVQTTAFDPCTIVFPSDKQTHCTGSIPEGGSPTWDEYPCNVVTAEIIKEDTFKFVEGACYKILREWAVIDWCVYKTNVGSEDNVDAVTSARKLDCNKLVKDGYYRYTQVLKVVDLIPPKITVEDKCVATTDCYAYNVEMKATASDTCNTNEEYWWKYKVENLDCDCEPIQVSYNYNPKPATAKVGKRSLDRLDKVKEAKLVMLDPLPEGNYKVTWTVGDGCGNATTTEQIFTVVDKKAPTPVLVNISTATMTNCMVEICAITFDKGGCNGNCISSFDNCTPKEELYFTFGPVLPKLYEDPVKWENQYKKYGRYFYDPVTGLISTEEKYLKGEAYAWDPIRKTSCRVFTSTQLASEADYTQILEVYVWDQFAENELCDDNNYDFGVVVLSINTEDDDCPKAGSLVSGTIKSCNSDKGINNVTVTFDDSEERRTSSTNSEGRFEINLPANSYEVSAAKKIDGINGLTTLDLVIIQKHLLGLKPASDICKMAAMDINSDGKLTAADILYGRKMLLGYSEAKSNYNFLSEQFILENTGNPTISLKDAYKMNINVEKGKIVDYVDFSGILAGDVNYSAGAVENRSGSKKYMVLDELELLRGETYEIPVYLSENTELSGMQFELQIDNADIHAISSNLLEITNANYRIQGNSVKVSWNGIADIKLDNEIPLMTITVTANADAHLAKSVALKNSMLTPEMYVDNEISEIEVKFRNVVGEFALHQNIPNPFSDKTVIGFDLPDANDYNLLIYDITGKTIKEISGNGVSGYNSLSISKKDLGGSGVFYYRLKSGDNTDTRKMILIE